MLNDSPALLASGGQVTDGSLLLLRPFTPVACGSLPNLAGSYRGAFQNADGASGEISALPISDDGHPTSFNGQVVVVAFGGPHTFELKGTINCDGRMIAIGQAAAGHLILDATGTPQTQ